MSRVLSYETSEVLGEASDALVTASADAAPTGAVCAYRDDDGVWQPLGESDAQRYEQMGETVATVYVEIGGAA